MDLKTKITEAAEQVLLTNGLAKTTTKEIARQPAALRDRYIIISGTRKIFFFTSYEGN